MYKYKLSKPVPRRPDIRRHMLGVPVSGITPVPPDVTGFSGDDGSLSIVGVPGGSSWVSVIFPGGAYTLPILPALAYLSSIPPAFASSSNLPPGAATRRDT